MTNDFRVKVRRDGPVICLAPQGELDIDTAPALEASVEALLCGRPYVLVVDLARVDFIDSSGLHALLTCKAEVEQAGGRFQVRQVRALPRRILEITGLDAVLDLADDEQGVRHLAG